CNPLSEIVASLSNTKIYVEVGPNLLADRTIKEEMFFIFRGINKVSAASAYGRSVGQTKLSKITHSSPVVPPKIGVSFIEFPQNEMINLVSYLHYYVTGCNFIFWPLGVLY
ncbi:hypothetical protein HAX54_022954, partial [Datura stramonium]|nr:hypothetical protein [Datura stramonium]